MTESFTKSKLNISVDLSSLHKLSNNELTDLVRQLYPALTNLNNAYNDSSKELFELGIEFSELKKEYDELQNILKDLRAGYQELQSIVEKIKEEENKEELTDG